MCTSLAQKRKFCSGGLVDTISAIGLLVRKHFSALSAAGQVCLKVGGPHPPKLWQSWSSSLCAEEVDQT